jgi:hypothetical protein
VCKEIAHSSALECPIPRTRRPLRTTRYENGCLVPYPHISLKSQIVDGLELDQLAVAELELAAFESGNTWDTSNVFIVEVSSSVIHTRRVMTVLTCLCDKVWITITASLVGASPVGSPALDSCQCFRSTCHSAWSRAVKS